MQSDENHEGVPTSGFLLLFTDGNLNPPGRPMIGGVLRYQRGTSWIDLPDGSFSKVASGDSIDSWEYEALIEGLTLAKRHGAKYVSAYMDRRSVVEQVNGRWKIKPALEPLRERVTEAASGVDFRLSWIPREMNAAADKLGRS